MVAVDQETISKELIHKAVDELSPENLKQLGNFIAYLRYKDGHEMDWFEKLYELFATVREAVAQSGMTEEEINQLIDEELEAFRCEQNAS